MKRHLLSVFIFSFLCLNVEAQTQLITNGNFSSSSGWTTSGNWYITPTYQCFNFSGGYAYAGNSSGQAVINETGDLKQTVTIPSNASSATFSFYVSASTDEIAVSTVYDYVNVYLLNASGTQLMQFSSTNIDNLHAGSPVTLCSGYNQKTFSIPSSYFGQQIQIDFRVHSDGGPKNTMFRIDDVSLTYTASTTCSYSLSSTSASPSSGSGNGSVSVTTSSGCSWTAVSNNTSWLTVTSGASGSGNGTVNYSYTQNTLSTSRTGTITIAGKTFTVTQGGATSGSLWGVDIYSGNGNVSWSQVYASGKSFAFVKATKGLCYTDGQFYNNMTSSNPGVVLGAYHFALPEDNPNAIDEANYFYNVAHSYIGQGYLPPALDMENPAGTCIVHAQALETYYNTAALQLQLGQWVNSWCDRIHTLSGIWPVVYVDRNHATLLYPYYQNGTINSNIKLWIADYGSSSSPRTPGQPITTGWSTWPWLFHQYFAPGTAGTNPDAYANPGMDQDIFNGNQTAFNNLISNSSSCTDQYESNNTVSSATLVFAQPVTNSSNYTTNGNIGFVGDDDWYKVNIGTCGTVTVNLSNLPGDYDIELWDKYASNGGFGSVLSGSYKSGTSGETVTFSYQGSNTAYIKVYAKDHQSYTTSSCYSIQFIFTPCTGGPPSNDICANATLLNVNTSCVPLTNQYLTNANSEGKSTVCDDTYPPTGYDVWYKFVATATTQNVTIDNGGKFYAHTAVYPDCSSAKIWCQDGQGVISYAVGGLTIGQTYYIQILDRDGYAQNMPFSICVYGTPAPCTTPATQASNISFSNVQSNQLSVNWTNGNTTGGRIVVAKAGSSIAGTPSNGTTYNASTSFGSGSSIVAGEYVVYNGTGSGPVTVTNLNPGITYYFRVFEYSCTGSNIIYKTTTATNNPNSQATSSSCITPGAPSNVSGTATGQNSANLSWSSGSSAGSPTVNYYWVVGTNQSVSYGNGLDQGITTATTAITNKLTCGTQYYLKVYAVTTCDNSQSGTVTSQPFTTSSCSCPGIAAPIANNPGNLTATSFQANWNPVNGAVKYFIDVFDNAALTSLVPAYNNLDVGNVTAYAITGLTCNKTYYYVVRAANSCDSRSNNSSAITVTTSACCNPPVITTQPTDQTAEAFTDASFTLAATGSGLSYQWQYYDGTNWVNASGGKYSGGNTQTLTITSVSVGIDGTKYRCMVTNTCTSVPSNEVKLTVTCTKPQTPTFTSSTGQFTFCGSANLILTANSAGCNGCGYTWNVSSQTKDLAITNLATTTTYEVTVTNVCGNTKASQTITVTPVPSVTVSATPNPVCQNNLVTLTASGANTYSWSGDNLNSTLGASVTANPATAGTRNYTVAGSSNGCSSSATIAVTVNATGTGNCIATAVPNVNGMEEFLVMPNPSPGIFIVKLKLNTAKEVQFTITNLLGERLYISPLYHYSGTVTKQINLPSLSNGMYQLDTKIGREHVVTKIVVVH